MKDHVSETAESFKKEQSLELLGNKDDAIGSYRIEIAMIDILKRVFITLGELHAGSEFLFQEDSFSVPKISHRLADHDAIMIFGCVMKNLLILYLFLLSHTCSIQE